jgi:hypothetical protein
MAYQKIGELGLGSTELEESHLRGDVCFRVKSGHP